MYSQDEYVSEIEQRILNATDEPAYIDYNLPSKKRTTKAASKFPIVSYDIKCYVLEVKKEKIIETKQELPSDIPAIKFPSTDPIRLEAKYYTK